MPIITSSNAGATGLTQLEKNSRNQSKSLNKIASGSKIPTAGADAAGLAVGTKIRSDIGALKQAATNTQQAQAMLKVADGALGKVGDILQRMKSLAAQSMSGSVDANSRTMINTEYQQLKSELDGIANQTQFGDTNLTDGTYNQNFLAGTDSGDVIAADLSTVDSQTGAGGLNVATTDVLNPANAQAAFASLDAAISTNLTDRATLGGMMSRFEFRNDVINSSIESLDAAQSAIMDVDIAAEKTNLTAQNVLTELSLASLAQANKMRASALSLVRDNR